MREMPASCKALLIAVLVFALDYYTKYLIVNNLSASYIINCCSILNVVHVENHGVAFGVFNSVHRFILIGLALAVLLGFLFYSAFVK